MYNQDRKSFKINYAHPLIFAALSAITKRFEVNRGVQVNRKVNCEDLGYTNKGIYTQL